MEAARPKVAFQVLEGGRESESHRFLRELYATYGGSVYQRCRFLLKDATQAEDAMQDVFAKVMDHAEHFRAEASPLTWLMKISTHHCLNLMRAERAPWRKLFQRQEAHRPEAQGGPEVLESRDLLRSLLSRVDTETQEAVVLYHVDGMTLEDVATALGRSVPTIRKRLSHFAELGGKEMALR